MNSTNPALVSQRAAQRLPRPALLLFCAAYVLPGLFSRDPWRNADITSFGYMLGLAEGRSSWLAPTVGGLPSDAALLPYWLGAVFIKLLGPWLNPALAARIPFALLLVLVLALVWYSCYHLARSDAAQPLPFAFGGEASPVDYARAIADGAVLALIATLGLLQLGHETTPELGQLLGATLFLYALAASPLPGHQPKLAVLAALPIMAASGAPAIAVALGSVGTLLCRRSTHAQVRRHAISVAAGTAAAALTALALGGWAWRIASYGGPAQALGILRQLAWFTWPTWPLAMWTMWRWRAQWASRHIALPLSCALVSLAAGVAMGGNDRALMLGLPALAVLAAFALPTLQRGAAAAIDWFSVFFFSVCAVTIWVIYVAMQTGVPQRPAANVARLAPEFVARFSPAQLSFAVLGTLAWVWLVQWRAGRHRHPLWKSMVLPASGVALCWLLLMTLWLPLLDHARSYRPLVQRVQRHIPEGACIAAPSVPRGQLVALEYFGRFRVDGVHDASQTACDYLVRMETRRRPSPALRGWALVAREHRPTDREEITAVYRRAGATP